MGYSNSIVILLFHVYSYTHLLRKIESWEAQRQTQRRENATDDSSDDRENHEVVWHVLILWSLGGYYRLKVE